MTTQFQTNSSENTLPKAPGAPALKLLLFLIYLMRSIARTASATELDRAGGDIQLLLITAVAGNTVILYCFQTAP